MSSWPHQERRLNELRESISQGEKRICFTSPTGGGKSRFIKRIRWALIPSCGYEIFTGVPLILDSMRHRC